MMGAHENRFSSTCPHTYTNSQLPTDRASETRKLETKQTHFVHALDRPMQSETHSPNATHSTQVTKPKSTLLATLDGSAHAIALLVNDVTCINKHAWTESMRIEIPFHKNILLLTEYLH